MAEKAGVWKPKNSRFYQMDFWVGRKRHSKSTKCTNKKAAIAYANKHRKQAELKLSRSGLSADRDMTLVEAIDRYMKHKGCFTERAGDLEREFNWILDQVGDHVMVTEVDDAMLADLVTAKRVLTRSWANDDATLAACTVNETVTKLLQRVLTRVKKTWKVPLPDEPDYAEHMLKVVQRVRELSLDEEDALMAAAGDTGYGALIQFIIACGLRKADALIRWDQIDRRLGIIKVIQKGDRAHEVRITPVIERLLEEAAPGGKRLDEEFVWTYKASRKTKFCPEGAGAIQPITYAGFSSAFKWILKGAKVKDFRIHDLRKTAGARFYRVCGCIGKVQVFLGHSNITMTRKHYLHITPLDIKDRLLASELFYNGLRSDAAAVATMH